jgi:hypothetical protein
MAEHEPPPPPIWLLVVGELLKKAARAKKTKHFLIPPALVDLPPAAAKRARLCLVQCKQSGASLTTTSLCEGAHGSFDDLEHLLLLWVS